MMKKIALAMERLRLGFGSVPGLIIYTLGVFIFLFLPISMIVVFSFNSSPAGVFPLARFTLRWYREVFTDPIIVASGKRSIVVALATALISGALGTLCAMGLTRYNFRLKGLVWVLLLMPMLLPGLMLGVSLLSYFYSLGIRLSLATVTITHIVWAVPYVVFIVQSRLQDFGRSIEEAAQDLGANAWQTFRRVTFPMIASSVIGAMLIVFGWSFNDFMSTFFTIGSEPTLSIVLWGMLRRGIKPTIHSIATLVLTTTAILLVAARRIGRIEFEF